MLKISLDKKQLQKELAYKLEKEKIKSLEATAMVALEELKLNTPIDTGAASEAWVVEFDKDLAIFTNDKDYIKQLNSGSSKQAPANFIETTLLNYGKPKGPIVTYE